MRATLTNLAKRRREEWTPVGLPHSDAKSLPQELIFKTDRGLLLRAVRGEDAGTHTTMYRVRTPYAPLQKIEGEFVTRDSLQGMRLPEVVPFKHHPWVADDASALIPKLTVRLNGHDHKTGKFLALSIISGYDPTKPKTAVYAHQRWHFKAKVGTSGFIVEGWVTFYHDSPVADVRVALVWSDRTTPAPEIRVDAIAFETGEIVKFDFALRNGNPALPAYTGASWVNLISGDLGFIDGSGLPLMGRMLCLPQGPIDTLDDEESDKADLDDPKARINDDVDSLYAAGDAPTYGVAHADVWDGKYLAHRNVARIDRAKADLQQLADGLYTGFENLLQTPSHYYDHRPIGTTKNPGRTGDQEDFNATKGWMASRLGDPRWMHYAMYSVTADFFRGVMHYDVDGNRLDPMTRERWVTWSGYTHWHHGQSPDRLDKRDLQWGEREATTYLGYDDQHRSQNNLAACYALTADPLLLYIIEHYSTTDIANVRERNNFGVGAPRAVGRTMLTWAHFLHLLDPNSIHHARYRQLRDGMKRRFLQSWWGDRDPGPVDILYAFQDPRQGVTWNGEVAPAWVVWEHGLMLQGIYAMWKFDRDPDWLSITRRVSRTIVKHATVKWPDGRWNIANNVHYPLPGKPGPITVDGTQVRQGDPLPAEHLKLESSLVNGGGGGVDSWAFPAVLMFVETLDDPNDEDLPIALEVIRDYANSQESAQPRTAEWYACVKSVVPTPGAYATYETVGTAPPTA